MWRRSSRRPTLCVVCAVEEGFGCWFAVFAWTLRQNVATLVHHSYRRRRRRCRSRSVTARATSYMSKWRRSPRHQLSSNDRSCICSGGGCIQASRNQTMAPSAATSARPGELSDADESAAILRLQKAIVGRCARARIARSSAANSLCPIILSRAARVLAPTRQASEPASERSAIGRGMAPSSATEQLLPGESASKGRLSDLRASLSLAHWVDVRARDAFEAERAATSSSSRANTHTHIDTVAQPHHKY